MGSRGGILGSPLTPVTPPQCPLGRDGAAAAAEGPFLPSGGAVTAPEPGTPPNSTRGSPQKSPKPPKIQSEGPLTPPQRDPQNSPGVPNSPLQAIFFFNKFYFWLKNRLRPRPSCKLIAAGHCGSGIHWDFGAGSPQKEEFWGGGGGRWAGVTVGGLWGDLGTPPRPPPKNLHPLGVPKISDPSPKTFPGGSPNPPLPPPVSSLGGVPKTPSGVPKITSRVPKITSGALKSPRTLPQNPSRGSPNSPWAPPVSSQRSPKPPGGPQNLFDVPKTPPWGLKASGENQ